MLAGQYVIHDGAVCHVIRITSEAPNYAGLPRPAVDYRMLNTATGEYFTLLDPTSDELGPLTPACEACGVPAGFCRGSDPHYRTLVGA